MTVMPPLMRGLLLLFGGHLLVAFAQDDTAMVSCVQASAIAFTSCPCDEASFSFTLTGMTTVEANTVNLAVVIDGSGSISADDFPLEKDFAKSAVAAFADRGLFSNGGTASYVQFASSVLSSNAATFDSLDEFNDFVDADTQTSGGTDIASGILEARSLLAAAPAASASFMIVITDGNGGDPLAQADAARAEGTVLFAVGVGSSVSEETLLDIAGSEDNVFEVDEFDQLEAILDDILDANAISTIACPSTGVSLVVDFNAPVVSASPGATISGTTVTFTTADIEENPTVFTAELGTCDLGEGSAFTAVSSIAYTDDQNNEPDFTDVLSAADVTTCSTVCPSSTAACKDPYLQGLRGQQIKWVGAEGGWYCLFFDEEADLQVNVRTTGPLPEDFPDRQYITGVAVLSEGHAVSIEVVDPYDTDTTGCDASGGDATCLTDGALRISVDGRVDDELQMPTRDERVADGILLSSANLPPECREFGGTKTWARIYNEMRRLRRRELSVESFEEWVLRFDHVAAPEWCTKYVQERGLEGVQSKQSVFRIATSFTDVRFSVGVNDRPAGKSDRFGRSLPELSFWQTSVGLEGEAVKHDAITGMLGETARPVMDADGRPVMMGLDALRGTVLDYRVSGPLGKTFALLDKRDP